MSLLSWPSPMRQPRNVRVLTGSRAGLTSLCGLPWPLPGPPLPPPRTAPAPPPPWGGGCPEGGISLIGPFRFFRASCCFSLAFRLPARSLCSSVFRFRLLLFLSCFPSYSSSCCILPHPRFAPLVEIAASAYLLSPSSRQSTGSI
jgi:hypothetical protein